MPALCTSPCVYTENCSIAKSQVIFNNANFLNFQTSCCNEEFGCLQCHNETQSHKAKVRDIKGVICLNCKYEHDGVTNICVQCGTQFGEVSAFV